MSFENLYLGMVLVAFAALAATLAFGQIYTSTADKSDKSKD